MVRDSNAQRAEETAHEWLDASDKAGIRPDANAEVERIGDAPAPGDLMGTERVADPGYPVEVVERGNESTPPTGTRWASSDTRPF